MSKDGCERDSLKAVFLRLPWKLVKGGAVPDPAAWEEFLKTPSFTEGLQGDSSL